MRIALIGPGAMGMLFGGYLSRANDLTLIGHSPARMQAIDTNGLTIQETDGTSAVYHPHATADASGMEPVDLVLLFTKAGASRNALETNRNLIGPNTLLMTLQNGAGHEAILQEFTDPAHVIIGTTRQGSYKTGDTVVCHSGLGTTTLGAITGSSDRFAEVAQVFSDAGFPASTSDAVRGMIYNKLMINASSSVLSGILQVPQGYVEQNPAAWAIAESLITELCTVATADGYPHDAAEQIDRIRKHLQAAPTGYTSIYADLKAGRRTEVDVINGAVVTAADRLGIPVPTHRLIVHLVHAMEGRG